MSTATTWENSREQNSLIIVMNILNATSLRVQICKRNVHKGNAPSNTVFSQETNISNHVQQTHNSSTMHGNRMVSQNVSLQKESNRRGKNAKSFRITSNWQASQEGPSRRRSMQRQSSMLLSVQAGVKSDTLRWLKSLMMKTVNLHVLCTFGVEAFEWANL